MKKPLTMLNIKYIKYIYVFNLHIIYIIYNKVQGN